MTGHEANPPASVGGAVTTRGRTSSIGSNGHGGVAPAELVGNLLVQRGLLSPALARLAGEFARRHQSHLIDTVLHHHMVQEEELGQMLADVNGWPYLSPESLLRAPVLTEVLRPLGEAHVYQHSFVVLGPPEHPTLVLANPYRTDLIDQVARRIRPRPLAKGVAARRAIQGCLIQAFPIPPQQLVQAIDELERSGLASGAATRVLADLIGRAVALGASDLHLEPGEQTTLRYRVGGLLHPEARTFPDDYHESFINMIQVLAGFPAGGRHDVKEGRLTWNLPTGEAVELRIMMTPMWVSHQRVASQVVMRLLLRHQAARTLDQLGYPPDQRQLIEDLVRVPRGLLLAAGQVNTGKTTTLYAILSQLASPSRKILTIEDPIEVPLGPLVQQHQVNEEAGFTYATAVRAFLRLDPDAMLIGEIRDADTAAQIVQASLQGKLTFTAIHAESAVHAIPRLLALGVEPVYLAATLKAIVSQRLVRRLCPDCHREVDFASLAHTRPEWVVRYGARFGPEDRVALPDPLGCARCAATGYQGLAPAAEILVVDGQVQELIEQRRGVQAVVQYARSQGFRPMREAALDLVRQRVTDFDEAERVFYTLAESEWNFAYAAAPEPA